MKEKFIRILSPIQIAIVAVLDAAVLYFLVFAIRRLFINQRMSVIFFTICVIFALVIAVLVTKEIFSHGIKFHDDEMEFTGLDGENIFAYADIEKVETEKDDKASLVKNFKDRQSKVILTLKEERTVTIDIGLTSKSVLNKIAHEICTRIV